MPEQVKPLVSVIIPNYNYAQYVGEAVESALSQTYSPIEVIVVDDGSTDCSLDLLKGFGSSIKLIVQKNAGVSEARNRGVQESTGTLIAFLDADDAWFAQKLEKQVMQFELDPALGMSHVGVVDIDEQGREIRRHSDGLEGNISRELLLFERPAILGGGSGVMIRKDAFQACGGFDTRLSTSADWDLFYQISDRFRVEFIPEVLVRYRIHGSNMHGNIARMESEMLAGFEKAFKDTDDEDLRRNSYGNLHRVLSGSYFRAGEYGQFIRHALKSISFRPANVRYFLRFPLRRFSKKA